MPRVAIVRGTDPYEATLAALNLLADDIPVPKNPVLLKPNLLMTKKNPIAVTDPKVCAAIADFLLEKNADCTISLGEGTTGGKPPDTFKSMQNNGYMPFQDRWTALDFAKDLPDKWFPIYSPGESRQIELGISKAFTDYSYVVSIPKFKTHDVLGLTLSLKNFMGTLVAARDTETKEFIAQKTTNVCPFMHGFGDKPPNKLTTAQNTGPSKVALATNLIRLATQVHPKLAVIDGIEAMEGDGPGSRGTKKYLGAIIAGTDFIAVDTVASHIAGMDLHHFQYIHQAGEIGLGESRISKISIIGEPFESITSLFETHHLYSRAKFTSDEIALLKKLSS
jgi:uncharacterized protein (DUF362 family)